MITAAHKISLLTNRNPKSVQIPEEGEDNTSAAVTAVDTTEPSGPWSHPLFCKKTFL